jgi:hypothetical protein
LADKLRRRDPIGQSNQPAEAGRSGKPVVVNPGYFQKVLDKTGKFPPRRGTLVLKFTCGCR